MRFRLDGCISVLPLQLPLKFEAAVCAGGLGGVLNSVPQFSLPGTDDLPEQLKPPMRSRSASFDVLFLDDDIRVTRGNRNEIRIFVRT